jgi:hypothetical protein
MSEEACYKKEEIELINDDEEYYDSENPEIEKKETESTSVNEEETEKTGELSLICKTIIKKFISLIRRGKTKVSDNKFLLVLLRIEDKNAIDFLSELYSTSYYLKFPEKEYDYTFGLALESFAIYETNQHGINKMITIINSDEFQSSLSAFDLSDEDFIFINEYIDSVDEITYVD